MKIFLGILIVFLLLQIVRPARNNGSVQQPKDIFAHYQADDSIKALLQTACYDCHSNRTNYPWYANIQPVGLWLNHHVNEGKEELNFSEFASYPTKKADHLLKECVEQVQEKEMPLTSYTLIHRDAKLDDHQRQAIIDWFNLKRRELR